MTNIEVRTERRKNTGNKISAYLLLKGVTNCQIRFIPSIQPFNRHLFTNAYARY